MAEKDGLGKLEGIASQFVTFLGLQDVIVGSLAMYCLHLAAGSATDAFESTGLPVVDIALLACGAALIGKIIGLSAAMAMALFYPRLRRGEHGTRLMVSADGYWVATGRT